MMNLFGDARAWTLINDVLGSPVTWRAQIWLQGVMIEEEGYADLGNGIVIRRPKSSDLQREVNTAFILTERLFADPVPSAVVEYSFQGSSSENTLGRFFVEQRIETLVQILRLYRVGSVETLGYEYTVDSYRYLNGTVGSGNRDAPQLDAYSYSIGQPAVEP